MIKPVLKDSHKYRETARLYKHFANSAECLDFSDEAMYQMFTYESYGKDNYIDKANNGFFHGKHGMDITVSMWKEDRLKGHLCLKELYDDVNIPREWVDKVLGIT